MRVWSATAISSLLLWTAGVQAYYGIDYNAKAAYFTYNTAENETQYVFTLNAVANGDIYFHMSGPVTHSWIGVGIGDSMKDSLMLLAYPSADGLNTTISPRLSTGHTEPVYDSSIEILKIYNDTYAPNANTVTNNGTSTIIAHAMCRNCSQWAGGFLDTRSTAQNFIFALGPNTEFRSDSLEASVPRHGFVGQFTMDMTQATNYTGWYGRVPCPNVPDFTFPPNDSDFAEFGSVPAFNTMSMSNPKPGLHAALMCLAFVIIFPLGAVIMRFLRRTLMHAAAQVLGFIFVFGGFGVAASFSKEYNKSKNYTSAHQILGIIILAGLVIQLGLGLIHHSSYVRTQKATPFGRIHFLFGPLIIMLGIINGGIGFHFAGNSHLAIPYAALVIVLFLIFAAVISCQLFFRNRRRKYKPEAEGTYTYPTFGEDQHQLGDDRSLYEMSQGQFVLTEEEPYYEPGMGIPFGAAVPAPYGRTVDVPFTPMDAYMPVTPRTWKKEEITNWPLAPYKDFVDD